MTEHWDEQVVERVMGKRYQDLWKLFPALLLTDSRPDQPRPDTMRLLIPLEGAEKRFGGLEVFFSELAKFARDRNPEFLKRFEDESRLLKYLQEGNEIIQAKPSFFGFGINLNAIAEKLLAR